MTKATLIDLRERRPAPPPGSSPNDEEPVTLYAKRKQIYPQLVHGRFRLIKWVLLAATLGVYYLLPFLRWDRGPSAPDQAVLADFAGGRFYFFALEIWPQEVYYITGLLILASVGLFLVTALFGRVWCGYFCPQTVWTDLFLVVERFFEGDRNARMRLDKAPLSFNKAWRKSAKHLVWVLIAFATGGAFILYWHDARALAGTFFTGHAPATAYVFAALLTFTTYALAGTMREQVCTYMCPWPRIQAALIDKDTLTITYRSERGDPRGPHKKGDTWEGRGDCIDCRQCVTACPMGIDIRKGPQLECIQCGLCIDACDSVMKKVGRPASLIAYDTDENVLLRWMKKPAARFRLLRPRTMLYAGVFLITAAVMTVGLATRSTLSLSALKDRALPYVQLSNGDIRNSYTLKIVNKQTELRSLVVHVEGIEGELIEVIGEPGSAPEQSLKVGPDSVDQFRLLVTAPASAVRSKQSRITIVAGDKFGRAQTSTLFSGPDN